VVANANKTAVVIESGSLGQPDTHHSSQITRRAVVLGAAGAIVVAGATSVVVGPKVVRRIRRNSVGPKIAVPVGEYRVQDFSFDSAARGRRVTCLWTAPPNVRADAPVVVWLHGRGGSAQAGMTDLRLPNFLASAMDARVEPFSIVTIDGGDRYWHRRRDGDDPEAMIVDELPRVLAEHAMSPRTWGIAGWSMGGYGALLLAERHPKFQAVAVSSPAVWFRSGDTRPGAFDDAADFTSHDVLGSRTKLPRSVRVDCGREDPFAPTSAFMLSHIDGVSGAITEGAHTMRFWRRVLPDQLRFLGTALAAA
jgi:S-formylglutathione hydrolase FrmB